MSTCTYNCCIAPNSSQTLMLFSLSQLDRSLFNFTCCKIRDKTEPRHSIHYKCKIFHLKSLVFTSVNIFFIRRLPRSDKGGLLRPGWEGNPRVIKHFSTESGATRAAHWCVRLWQRSVAVPIPFAGRIVCKQQTVSQLISLLNNSTDHKNQSSHFKV